MKAMVLLTSWAVTVVGLVVCTSPFVAAQVPGTPKEMPTRIERRMFTKDITEAIREELRRFGYTFEFGSFDLRVEEEDGKITGEAMFITRTPDGNKLRFHHKKMTFLSYISPLSGYSHTGYLYHLEHDPTSPPPQGTVAYILFGSRPDKDTNQYYIVYYDYEFNPTFTSYDATRASE